MATFPLDKPYFPEASWRKIKPSDYTTEEVAAINYHAPSTGGKYVVLMMLATLGYVIADVAADGVVVEYAQREPVAIRGRTQTAIYTVRSIFSIFGSVLVGFGLSSPPYGGDFDFGISFQCFQHLGLSDHRIRSDSHHTGANGTLRTGWDWRHVIVLTTIAVVALDSVCTMLTTWDIVRNQWFWLGLPVVETIPSSVNFIVSSFVVVELADEGNEAAIYGLLTTVGNLSNPFSATLTKAINEPFAVSNRDILNDSHSTRRDVTIIVLISYTSKLLSLLFLGWLPRQKAETQILKRCGNRSKLFGGITIVYCLFALTWSLLINLLGIFESTRCLKIVGGC
ncbi:Folate-biopterin transporter [Phytophthora cactorum]|nr:Folate-biopterin transporter [Phytophthora cactorum]